MIFALGIEVSIRKVLPLALFSQPQTFKYCMWNGNTSFDFSSPLLFLLFCVYVGARECCIFTVQHSEFTQINRWIRPWEMLIMPVISVGQLRKAFPFSPLFAISLAESVSRIKCISIIVALNLFIIWCLLYSHYSSLAVNSSLQLTWSS